MNGTVIENLVVRLVGDNSDYKRSLKEANETLKGFTRDGQGYLRDAAGRFAAENKKMEAATTHMAATVKAQMTSAMSSVRSLVGGTTSALRSFQAQALGALGVGSVGALLYKTVSDASDANESIAKFTAVYGKEAKTASKFVGELADEIGRSESEIRKALSAYQSIFVGLEFGQTKAAKMSMELEKLTLDFAAFHNISDEEAMTRFVSAMSGSAEVLDQFGVNIRQAALQDELFRRGIHKSVTQATEAEKTMARLNVVMEVMGSQGAIGAAARESQSFANRMKDLKAEVQDLSIAVGNQLMQPALETVKWMKDLTVSSNEAATGVGGIGDAFVGLADTLHYVALGFSGIQAAVTSAVAAAVSGLNTLTNGGTGLAQGAINTLSGIPQLAGLSGLGQLALAGEDGKGLMPGLPTYVDELNRAAAEQTGQYEAMKKTQMPSERFAARALAETSPAAASREVNKLTMGGESFDNVLISAAKDFGTEVVDVVDRWKSNAATEFWAIGQELGRYNQSSTAVDKLNKATAGSAVRFGSAESELTRRSKVDSSVEKNTAKLAANSEVQKRLAQRADGHLEGMANRLGEVISIPR